MITTTAPAEIERSTEFSFLPSRNQFFLLILAYLSVHLVTRTLISETAGLDEADQIVLGQKLSWGYGPQPPLYTWLSIAFLRVFGMSVFSLTLLRELMLFGIYSLSYAIGRTVTGRHAVGVAAAVALQFHPTIMWESQRELTHSILASMMGLGMLLAFFCLRPKGWAAYLAFGLFGGLCVISKYNGALLYGALLMAALSLPGCRARLLDRRMAAAIALSLFVTLPNLGWAFNHRDLALASMFKFGIDQSHPWFSTVGKGMKDWCSTVAQHSACVVISLSLLFWRPIFVEHRFRLRREEARLLWRVLAIIFLLVVVSIMVFNVTTFRDRWLQPIGVTLPLLLILTLEGSLTPARLKALLGFGLAVSAVVAVLAPGRVLFTERLNKRELLNAPFRGLAPDLAPLVRNADFLVSADRSIAANVHLRFPDKLAISPDLMEFFAPTGAHCLLVWEANQHPDPPPSLLRFGEAFAGHEPQCLPTYIDKVWKYHHRKAFRLGVMSIDRSPAGSPRGAGR